MVSVALENLANLHQKMLANQFSRVKPGSEYANAKELVRNRLRARCRRIAYSNRDITVEVFLKQLREFCYLLDIRQYLKTQGLDALANDPNLTKAMSISKGMLTHIFDKVKHHKEIPKLKVSDLANRLSLNEEYLLKKLPSFQGAMETLLFFKELLIEFGKILNAV